MAEEFEVFLQGGSPWGFRLQGGKEFRLPLKISKVEPNGKAGIGGVKVGDHVLEINGNDTSNLYHTEALTTVKRAQYSLSLVLKRPEENNNSSEPAHTIQSVSLAPEDSKTRVSLTIAAKSGSQPSSPKNKFPSQESLDAPTKRKNVPSGQAYMQKLVGSLNDLDDDDNDDNEENNDLPPQDRVRSKTLPKSYGKKRQEEMQQRRSKDDDQYTKSLPRSKSSSDNAPPNKAPHWYKDMYKQMHTSMEGESHLSKLLSSDAKRGAFRKYDGASSPRSPRSLSPDDRRSSFGQQSNDAPRRLQGGRSIANHPHRKSLPNIHAANFNFMNPDNFTSNSNSVSIRVNAKPTTTNSNTKKAVNSEWYRNLQKGGDIPEGGLANKNSDRTDSSIKKSASSTNIQGARFRTENDKTDTYIVREPPVNRQPHATVDFLELRKQELKNQEIENEREQIRQARERERLAEEERLKKQKEIDRQAAAKTEAVLTSPQIKTPPKEQKSPIQKSPPSPIEIEEPKLPEYGRAKYSFHPQGPGELEFRKGETVRVLRGIDENWVEGEHNGYVGIFPISYIEFIEDPSAPTSKSLQQNKTSPEQQQQQQREQEEREQEQREREEREREQQEREQREQREREQRERKEREREQREREQREREQREREQREREQRERKELEREERDREKREREQQRERERQEEEQRQKQQQQKWSPPKEEKLNGYHTSGMNDDVNGEDEASSSQGTQEYNIQEGLGRAKYTFKAETDSELSFKKGDMITILKQVDENWYEGELDDQIGIFPSNYIEVIEEPIVVALEPKSKKKEVAPQNPDLDFEKIFSDVLSQPISQQQSEPKVTAYEQNMNAMNDARNHNGYHQQYEEPEPTTNGGNDIDDLIGKGEPHRAVYQYNPTNEDEVELKVGDIVHVLEKCDDGWYIGTCERTGVFGTFPGNYVTLVS